MVQKVYFLEGGYLTIDRSILLYGQDFGVVEKSSVYSVLLKMKESWALIDTGLNPLGLTEPEKAWGERAKLIKPVLTADDDIRNRLAVLGLKTDDISYVINTHLHWDHTGGNRFFDKAVFFVQKAEYRYAYQPDKHLQSSYMKDHFDCGVKYELVDGDAEILPGVFLLHTPGHTPGHQSVLIKMASGAHVIIAGDAIYTRDNLEHTIPPGHSWNQEFAIFSIHKIKTLQGVLQAKVMVSHDPGFWGMAPKSPVCLE
ncbi:MAG: N-acyl homoserine lactonase family protein [Peptococcaceae bacterium]|jgi:N-acyl homoserine lactone hydrolase|nr:N-acyl homoserine lactonase family protein [Peptococcaceae bacterium]MDH7526398.1 N-acyl homoserine lactonase family protein [Peptococcaceae bacterium]